MAHNYHVYQCPEEHLRAGLWTFTVNGAESLYYSPSERGIQRVVQRLQQGRTREVERGRALLAQAVSEEGASETAPAPSAEDVAVAAFMSRGKLGRKEEE